MKLINEKINTEYFFSVGFDEISGKYILDTVITYVSWYSRFYIITKEEYEWFDNDMEKLIELEQDCFKKNTSHERFYFSEMCSENTKEQEEKNLEYLKIGLNRQ